MAGIAQQEQRLLQRTGLRIFAHANLALQNLSGNGGRCGQTVDIRLYAFDLRQGLFYFGPGDVDVRLPRPGFQQGESSLGLRQLRVRRIHRDSPPQEVLFAYRPLVLDAFDQL
jgi:hypothetical protein